MELPPYRIPTMRNTLIHMWDKSVQYLQKMATVILVASIIIWALEYFPRTNEKLTAIEQNIENVKSDDNISEADKIAEIDRLERLYAATHSENSYIGRFGHFIEPIVRPLGFDWRIGVSLVTGIAAKEVIISTMAVFYQAEDNYNENDNMEQLIQKQTWKNGKYAGETIFSPLVAYGLMLFVLLCTPCIAALTAIKREAGLKWAVFSMIYSTGLAWIVSFLVYQIGSLIS